MKDNVLRNKIRAYMNKNDVKQTRLSLELGKGQNFIREFLTGDKVSMKLSDVELIAKKFGVPITQLLDLAEDGSSAPNSSINIEILSAVIEQIETMLDEDESELEPDKKAKIIALCYKHLYTDKDVENNVINFSTIRDLISVVS